MFITFILSIADVKQIGANKNSFNVVNVNYLSDFELFYLNILRNNGDFTDSFVTGLICYWKLIYSRSPFFLQNVYACKTKHISITCIALFNENIQ